jgi:iron-sulfur cluster repair protein YtfE (RIC family)
MSNPITQFFEADHQRLDKIFSTFQQADMLSPQAIELFSDFKRGLLKHIDWEESFLFPEVEEAAGFPPNAGPTHVMRIEHFQIKECLELIENKLNNQQDSSLVQDRLLDILAEHNMKEERVLYPMSDQSIDQQIAIQIIAKCKNT